MSEQHTPPPSKETQIYHTDPETETTSQWSVIDRQRSSLLVEQTRDGGDTTITKLIPEHTAFTAAEAADLAGDLLSPTDPNQERSADDAVKEVLADPDPDKAQELELRLATAAMSKLMDAITTPEHFESQTAEQIVGSSDIRGSNSWRIDEIIDGIGKGIYTDAVNQLQLAEPSKDIALLADSEASRIKAQIEQTNRQALDTIYDNYAVDFEQATVYEKTHPGDIKEVVTVYPAMESGVSFTETRMTVDKEQSFQVHVQAGMPSFLPDDGYQRAV